MSGVDVMPSNSYRALEHFITMNYQPDGTRDALISRVIQDFLKGHVSDLELARSVIIPLAGRNAFHLIPAIFTEAVVNCADGISEAISVSRNRMYPAQLFIDFLMETILPKIQNGYVLRSIIRGLIDAYCDACCDRAYDPDLFLSHENFVKLVRHCLKDEYLAKIRNGMEVAFVTEILIETYFSHTILIPMLSSMLLKDGVLAKIIDVVDLINILKKLAGFLLNDGPFPCISAKDADRVEYELISNILSSDVILKRFPIVCDERFSCVFSDPLKKKIVGSAIQANTRWSPMREAWVEAAFRGVLATSPETATVIMGAGAPAGGVSVTLPIKRFSPERAALIEACRRYSYKYSEDSAHKGGMPVITTLLKLLGDAYKKDKDDEIKIYLEKRSGIYNFFGATERKRLIKPSADAFLESLDRGHEASP